MFAMNRDKIPIVLTRLEEQFGRQTRFSSKPPMEQLIATILSQRTNYANERQAYERMWERFGSWEGIVNAPLDELTEAIASSNYPEIKAPRIKAVLRSIQEECGAFNLDFLADWPVKKAQEWLMRFEGVGHKTATFLLLFSLRKPVLPVDTHVHRVSQRVGIIGPKVNQAKAHTVLLEMLPPDADELLNYHKLLFKHGQQVCTWSYPRCGQCVLQDICDYYQNKVAEKKAS